MAHKDEFLPENVEESDEESEDNAIIFVHGDASTAEENELQNPQIIEKTSFRLLRSEVVSLIATLIIVVFAVSFFTYSAFFKDTGETLKIVEPETKFNYALQIDINNAEPQMFELLPGIGPKIAQKIVDYRENVGGFQSVDELEKVKGISLRMVNRLRPFIYVEQSENTAD